MNTAMVMLGSNLNAEENRDIAIEKLTLFFDITRVSSVLVTQPVGEKYKADFQNQAIKLLSADNLEDTKFIFKQIEKEMGRLPDSKLQGLIPIDIDLIFWNENLVSDDYIRFKFVKQCIDEIS